MQLIKSSLIFVSLLAVASSAMVEREISKSQA